ncbi:MAG TPA: nitrogen regulation protein NR(I) [Geminicoccaceae bacterium]|jgi:two-component system nitrogen regulation response regulator GlnG|nr:nitrogen regulation protein NR(I) [Geminicoccaceae bacterium]HZA65343.1 nitrogen regulation protein NR(I) [Geminicoccaceae bacterium]
MADPTVIVADDDAGIRTVISRALSREGYRVQATGTATTLWRWIEDDTGDVAILDVVLPDENTLDLLPRIRQRRPGLPVIIMSAQNTLLTAVRATERGAFDYLPKPFDLAQLVTMVKRALALPRTTEFVHEEPNRIQEQLPIIGRSPPMQEIYRVVARLVGTDLTVMINGESGTGKELVAQAIHDYGKRRSGPFIAVNMAAIPRELVESELFGHEKGAFTGANARKVGRFEQAEDGTLFLDEIGDMPIEAQTRLLRVLQSGEFMPVGGRVPIKADLRIVAATHRDLRQLVGQGLFREDLFYRLNVVPIRLPPLRERTEDIPALVQHFLNRARADGLPPKTVEPAAMARLKSYDWPGNVRELENLVRRLTVLYAQDTIGAEVIEAELREGAPVRTAMIDVDGADAFIRTVARYVERIFADRDGRLPPAGLYGRILREVERPLIARVLTETRGNQLRAAALLGVNRNTLRKKIRELDIEVMRGPR